MIASRIPNSILLRISITDRCQLRCKYCMPEKGIQTIRHDDVLSYEEIIFFVRSLQQEFDLQKVRITGGDPLVRLGVERFAAC